MSLGPWPVGRCVGGLTFHTQSQRSQRMADGEGRLSDSPGPLTQCVLVFIVFGLRVSIRIQEDRISLHTALRRRRRRLPSCRRLARFADRDRAAAAAAARHSRIRRRR